MIQTSWAWVRRYAIALVLIVLLTVLLGHSQIFGSAPLAPRGLTAAHLVRFVGDAAALLLLWLAAWRAANILRDDGGRETIGRETLVPLATMFVLVIGYGVPLILLRPFMNDTAMAVYNWAFVLAIGASAIWLALAVYRIADALAPILSQLARAVREAAAARHDEAAARSDQAAARHDTPHDAETLTLAERRCPTCGRITPRAGDDVAA